MYSILRTVYFSYLLVGSQNIELHGGFNACSVRAKSLWRFDCWLYGK